jgi:hypothetical protein
MSRSTLRGSWAVRAKRASTAGALEFGLVKVGESFALQLDLFKAAHRETQFGCDCGLREVGLGGCEPTRLLQELVQP